MEVWGRRRAHKRPRVHPALSPRSIDPPHVHVHQMLVVPALHRSTARACASDARGTHRTIVTGRCHSRARRLRERCWRDGWQSSTTSGVNCGLHATRRHGTGRRKTTRRPRPPAGRQSERIQHGPSSALKARLQRCRRPGTMRRGSARSICALIPLRRRGLTRAGRGRLTVPRVATHSPFPPLAYTRDAAGRHGRAPLVQWSMIPRPIQHARTPTA